jgi:hypothetical protein
VAPRPPTPSPTREEFTDDDDVADQEYRPPAAETGDTDEDIPPETQRRRRGDPIPPNTPTGKRQTNHWGLTDEAEKKAIPYLEVHEVLWDNAHKDHGNKDIVADGWKDFETFMGGAYSAHHLSKWATNLRTQIGRLKKKRQGVSGQAPDRWSCRSKFQWNHAGFLLDTIQERSYEVSSLKIKWYNM